MKNQTPVLSIVTGTYNRLPYLKRMIASVRASIPRGLDYECVVCDGGSTDGTLDWLRSLDDVVLIEHGALRGALTAFGDAARAATGDYVILANDDIVFHPGALVRALAHLEMTPTCGAVAFADDRPAPGYDAGYKVQTISARQGRKQVSVPYPQVGMVRRWLGNEVGWWGDQHPVMGTGRTYGGDNFLGARIWELGYTVDAVDGCRIDDLIPADPLREHNYAAEQQNPGVYYKVYPSGPKIASTPQCDNPQSERLRILYAPIFEPGYPQQKAGKRGLREALARAGLVYEWDYLGDVKPGLAERVREWQPHLVLLQLHGTDKVTERDLVDARQAAPEAVFLNWNGDVWPEHLISPDMLSLLRHVDLQLVVNARVVPLYAERGIRAAYWQVAYEPVDESQLPAVAAHDVVFLANAYSTERKQLGKALATMAGVNVGLYGFGWPFPSGNTTYNFPATAALYRNAKIAIGDNQYPDETGFVSNRIFDALTAGAFLLHQHVSGLDELTDLRAGEHYVVWRTPDELQRAIRYWLEPKHAAERQRIASAGQAFVRAHHNFDARVAELFDTLLPMIEDAHEPVTA